MKLSDSVQKTKGVKKWRKEHGFSKSDMNEMWDFFISSQNKIADRNEAYVFLDAMCLCKAMSDLGYDWHYVNFPILEKITTFYKIHQPFKFTGYSATLDSAGGKEGEVLVDNMDLVQCIKNGVDRGKSGFEVMEDMYRTALKNDINAYLYGSDQEEFDMDDYDEYDM